jgi:hypothetical protein
LRSGCRTRHNIKIDNSSFKRVEEFKYLGTTLTNQNSLQEGIKSRLKLERGEVYTGFWWGNLRERDHGRPNCRWEDNIKMDLQEVGCGGID